MEKIQEFIFELSSGKKKIFEEKWSNYIHPPFLAIQISFIKRNQFQYILSLELENKNTKTVFFCIIVRIFAFFLFFSFSIFLDTKERKKWFLVRLKNLKKTNEGEKTKGEAGMSDRQDMDALIC